MAESIMILRQPRSGAVAGKGFVVDLALLAALWSIASVVVNPIGEFPLVDDWSFTRSVNHLVETGEFRPLGWAVMTLLTHVLWGALFCLPDGCTFTALRLSTLVLSLFGVFGTYVLVRDLQQPRWLALLIALTLGFNPIYYALSNTFMTDVPFIALSVWAAVLLGRCLRSNSDIYMLLGTLFALAATLSRQLGLFVPMAFAISMLLRLQIRPRAIVRAFTPLIVCAGILLAFNYWMDVSGRSPVLYGDLTNRAIARLTHPSILLPWLFYNSHFVLGCLGIFLLPVVALSAGSLWRSVAKRTITFGALGIVAIAIGAVFSIREIYRLNAIDLLMPIPDRGNIIGKAGLGPLSVRDTQLLHLDDHMPAFPVSFWVGVTAFCFFGAILLITRFSVHASYLVPKLLRRRPTASETEVTGVFLVLCAMIYLPVFLVIGFFDRYLVPVVPFLAAGFAALSAQHANLAFAHAKASRTVAFALVAIIGLFSVVSTRDWLGWNRLRWQALTDLMQIQRIDPKNIDGGFEFNGLHFYDPNYKYDRAKSSWWVQDDTYMIGLGPVPGYTVIKEYSYQHWLPPRQQKVVTMRRN
jgi:4-amino-4-deoxy-L-arabinose transferase-like glycosyltransferase